MVKYIEVHRGSVLTNSDVKEIIVNNGKATGVKLPGGKIIEARKGIVANTEPKRLFLEMVGEDHLDSSFVSKVKRFKYSTVSQVMVHAALDEWLDYNPEECRRAGILQIGESVDSVSRAFNDCMIGRPPDEPFMTIDNTTCSDTSRAPLEKHIMWNFARAPAHMKNGSWEKEKEKFADRCIDLVSKYAPNAKKIILKRVVLSPEDIEKMNPNLVNGDAGVGKATLDQSLSLRPFPGWSNYRTPIKGLYTCGAYNHGGGGVSGAPAHNCVTIILQDVKGGRL